VIAYKLHTKIHQKGHLKLRNLPLNEGDEVDIIILKKQKTKNLQGLIANNHIWDEEDIKAVEEGREVINQWKISS